jgi:hypothetical protein
MKAWASVFGVRDKVVMEDRDQILAPDGVDNFVSFLSVVMAEAVMPAQQAARVIFV